MAIATRPVLVHYHLREWEPGQPVREFAVKTDYVLAQRQLVRRADMAAGNDPSLIVEEGELAEVTVRRQGAFGAEVLHRMWFRECHKADCLNVRGDQDAPAAAVAQ